MNKKILIAVLCLAGPGAYAQASSEAVLSEVQNRMEGANHPGSAKYAVKASGASHRIAPIAAKQVSQWREPGWKKFLLNYEEKKVVGDAAVWTGVGGMIAGAIIGWGANAWLGVLLGFMGGFVGGFALGALFGYLFVKICS